MCKDHDLQHYAIDLRNLAREIACGNAELASELLDSCTYDGLASFMNEFDRYCEDSRLERIDDLTKKAFKQRKARSLMMSGDIINAWDTEMMDMIPY